MEEFIKTVYNSLYRPKKEACVIATLSRVAQGKKKSLQSYIDQFTQVYIEVKGAEKGLKCSILESGLIQDHPSDLRYEAKGKNHLGNAEHDSLLDDPRGKIEYVVR